MEQNKVTKNVEDGLNMIGYISVKCEPDESAIIVNGKKTGIGKIKKLPVKTGDVSISASYPEYITFDTTVSVDYGSNNKLRIELSPGEKMREMLMVKKKKRRKVFRNILLSSSSIGFFVSGLVFNNKTEESYTVYKKLHGSYGPFYDTYWKDCEANKNRRRSGPRFFENMNYGTIQ